MKIHQDEDLEELLGGSWTDFEAWIRKTVGSDFIWSIRPVDSTQNREMVIEAIYRELKKNDGIFPKKGPWIELCKADK